MKKVVLIVLVLIVTMSWASESDWTYDEVENIVLGNVDVIDTVFCEVSSQRISGVVFPTSILVDVSSNFKLTDALIEKLQKDFESKMKEKNLSDRFDFKIKIKLLGYHTIYTVGSKNTDSYQRVQVRLEITENTVIENLDSVRTYMLEKTNNFRTKNGIHQLRPNSFLNELAQTYAQELADSAKRLEHKGITNRISLTNQKYRCFNFSENEAFSWGLDQVFDLWLNSPGHRRNISSSEDNSIGAGIVKRGKYYYCVLIFASIYDKE